MREVSTPHRRQRPWRRWALFFGMPSAATALSSVWLYEPRNLGTALTAAAVAVASVFVFAFTMPRRKAPTSGARGSHSGSASDG